MKWILQPQEGEGQEGAEDQRGTAGNPLRGQAWGSHEGDQLQLIPHWEQSWGPSETRTGGLREWGPG